MQCSACDSHWVVNGDWLERWQYGDESCPGCGAAAGDTPSARVTVDPNDPAMDDDTATHAAWYHTSTHPDWPRQALDPLADLDDATKRHIGPAGLASYVRLLRGRALHVGTYEAAVQNMLRRMDDENDLGPFYLYRVRLKASCSFKLNWETEPVDWLGNVPLAEVCPAGIDAVRYLNENEDPGGISLALGRSTIHSVQQVPIPLRMASTGQVEKRAMARMVEASQHPAPPPRILKGGFALPVSTRLDVVASDIAREVAEGLPALLREQFEGATVQAQRHVPAAEWVRLMLAMVELIEYPDRVLASLDAQPSRIL
jgi:hypothetical protein